MSEKRRTVAIVGAAHVESLRCIAALEADAMVDFLLIGKPEEIQAMAAEEHLDIGRCIILPVQDDVEATVVAASAVAAGSVQVLMKGSVHTTHFVKSILDKSLGLLLPGAVLSHVARVTTLWYHKPFFLTDAAININPDLDRKVALINNALLVAHSCGIVQPKVGIIGPVETVNPRISSTSDAAQLAFLQQNTGVFGNALVEGPFGLDVALSAQAARIKGIKGEVPGDVDILLLPNLDAANCTLKAFTAVPGTRFAGIVIGARIPVVLTSRSDSKESRLESLKLALSVST